MGGMFCYAFLKEVSKSRKNRRQGLRDSETDTVNFTYFVWFASHARVQHTSRDVEVLGRAGP